MSSNNLINDVVRLLQSGVVLIYGRPGSGKTSLAGWYAKTMCDSGRRILWVSFYETDEKLRRLLASRGIEIRWPVLDFAFAEPEGVLRVISDSVIEHRPDVVVIDGVNVLGEASVRQLYTLLYRLDVPNLIMIGEVSMRDSPAAYIADAVLEVSQRFDRYGNVYRTIRVVKSRFYVPSRTVIPFIIVPGSIRFVGFDLSIGPMVVVESIRYSGILAREMAKRNLPDKLAIRAGTMNIVINDIGERGFEFLKTVAEALSDKHLVLFDVHGGLTQLEGYHNVGLVVHDPFEHLMEGDGSAKGMLCSTTVRIIPDGDVLIESIGLRKLYYEFFMRKSCNHNVIDVVMLSGEYWDKLRVDEVRKLIAYSDTILRIGSGGVQFLKYMGWSVVGMHPMSMKRGVVDLGDMEV